MEQRRSPSHSPSSPPSIASSDSSVDVITSITASLDLDRTNSPYTVSLSHLSSETITKIYKQLGWADAVNERIKRTREVNDRIRKERRARGAIKRRARRLKRLEARLGPKKMAAREHKRLKRQQMKASAAAILKEAGMKRELKRAKTKSIYPRIFETIDLHENGTEEDQECNQGVIIQDNGTGLQLSTFAGQIVIQDHFSAMRQALSEHARDGTRRKEPGRHSYHVDAAFSSGCLTAGIAVVHKSHRQDWASPWTGRGYSLHQMPDSEDAETWAIWQALRIILEKVRTDRGSKKPEDPCSLAVIYSDCTTALQKIGDNRGRAAQKIAAQSIELYQLGVDVQLHWVPGHRNIPGNELADLISHQAKQSVK